MPVLSNTRYENFAQGVFSGLGLHEAAIKAGYSPKCPSVASRVAKNSEVIARLEELKAACANARVLSVAKRKEILSDIAQEQHRTQSGITRVQNMTAIDLLNKMENVYQERGPLTDNRSYTINVISEHGKRDLKAIIEGEGRVKQLDSQCEQT